jgi:hypothetical protein
MSPDSAPLHAVDGTEMPPGGADGAPLPVDGTSVPAQHAGDPGSAVPAGMPDGGTPPSHAGGAGAPGVPAHLADAASGQSLGAASMTGASHEGVPQHSGADTYPAQQGQTATPAGAPGQSGGGMMGGMGAMGGGGGAGGGGGDHERGSRAYNVDGGVLFDAGPEPSQRITGSLDDDDDLSPTFRTRR